jgi:hypothetical protein
LFWVNTSAEIAPDPRLERQLDKLDRLSDLGLEIAEGLADQAKGRGPKVVEGDIALTDLALAYSRVSRAVRLTVMLHSKLMQEHKALKAEAADLAARYEPAYVHKMRVERIVERLAKREHRDDEDEIDRLVIEAGEHLDDEDRLENITGRPVGELVALICKDLGLEPDWAKLAQEPWAQAEMASGARGSPFAQFSPPPPQAAGGGPLAAERVVEGEGLRLSLPTSSSNSS